MKVISLNLQSGIGMTKGYYQYFTEGWKYFCSHPQPAFQDALTFLSNEKADFVLITEIDGGSARSSSVNQVEAIRTSLEGHAVFFPTTRYGKRYNQGNAIISRYPILSSLQHELPGRGEKRFLGEAKIKTDEGEIDLFVTHLSLSKTVRILQFEAIKKIIQEKTGPVILGGDLNTHEAVEKKVLMENLFSHAVTAPTYPSWNPKKYLDFILLTDHFHIKKVGVYAGVQFSDHIPLVCEAGVAGLPI